MWHHIDYACILCEQVMGQINNLPAGTIRVGLFATAAVCRLFELCVHEHVPTVTAS